jgi:hypothetical protein
MRVRLTWFVLITMASAVACSSSGEPSHQAKGSLRKCVPNQTLVCTCGIDRGSQTCSEAGELSVCDCSVEGKKRAPTGQPDAPAEKPVTVAPGTPAETPAPDGGVSANGPGPLCTALKACCVNVRAAEITGSADQCDRAVAAGDELGCYVLNEDFKKPEDTYDPVCF